MTVTELDIKGLKKHGSGKVREIYDLGDSLLMIATDRISAFDVILPGGIENKGKVLTQISLFWFDMMKDVIPGHVITADTDEIIKRIGAAGAEDPEAWRETLDGRAIITVKAKPLPVECIVRGYLAGSAWKEYKTLRPENGSVTLFGVKVPAGMEESEMLPEPCFTPSTKAEEGHDMNITAEECCRVVGKETGETLKEKSLAIYTRARDYAAKKGVIICDTKFEFGFYDGRLIIIDEILTPDSSRFWDASVYKKGKSQPSYDKQYVRDYLETLDWNKEYPGPELPEEIRKGTQAKYAECYRLLTGKELK